MDTGKKTFAVRDVSRALIAFGVLIMVLNFNHYLIVYIFGIITLILGFLNLFSLNLKIKLAGALNMVLAGVYFILFALLLYPGIFGLLGTLLFIAMGLVLLIFSIPYILNYKSEKEHTGF